MLPVMIVEPDRGALRDALDRESRRLVDRVRSAPLRGPAGRWAGADQRGRRQRRRLCPVTVRMRRAAGRLPPPKLWRAMASGGALAHGRRPWLGLRFHTLFQL